MDHPIELSNKVCLIVGASGAIGSAVASRFQQEGADLALGYHQSKPDSHCSGLIRTGRVPCFQFDLRDAEEIRKGVRDVEIAFGRVDVLVNCAGVIGPIGPLETLDLQNWAGTIEINLLGAVHLVSAVLPGMKKRRQGKIILFSGGGAAYARPFFTPYSSSKAALVRFAESVAHELQDVNVQVNAVAPGPVKSRMWDEMRAAGLAGGPKLLEEIKNMDETGGASPSSAADLAVFLASERSGKLSGKLLSALWDDWKHLDEEIDKIASSDIWTLRRVQRQ